MKKRGQYSTEALIVAGFALFLFTTAFFFLTRETGEQQENLERAQLDKFGKTVVGTVNQLAKTPASKATLELTLPQGVQDLYIERNNSIVFNYSNGRTTSELLYFADVDIVFDINTLNHGARILQIEAKQNYVSICDQDTDYACNKVCDFLRNETPTNSPGDCCKSDCSACTEDNNYVFCTNDTLCHTECYRHNGCSVIC